MSEKKFTSRRLAEIATYYKTTDERDLARALLEEQKEKISAIAMSQKLISEFGDLQSQLSALKAGFVEEQEKREKITKIANSDAKTCTKLHNQLFVLKAAVREYLEAPVRDVDGSILDFADCSDEYKALAELATTKP